MRPRAWAGQLLSASSNRYNIPLSAWTTSMYVLQSAMIFVYSLVFTVLLAIPLGIFFLGGARQALSVHLRSQKPACGLAFFVHKKTSHMAGF
ncbi:DUF2534 family protein [Enterobacter cloacae]|uniref:DUF2534 family protein n=1 Tax=Enterobacter cloacae TaxID=550 RepID=UPI003D1D74B3